MAQHQRRARKPNRVKRFASSWMSFARRGGNPAKSPRHGTTRRKVS